MNRTVILVCLAVIAVAGLVSGLTLGISLWATHV